MLSATSTMGFPLPMPGPVDFDIKDQQDSPLRLVKDEKIAGRLPGSPVMVRNDGGSTIAAFVLRVDVEPFGGNQVVILGRKGLSVGDSRVQSAGMPRVPDGAAKPVVSVDYVRFADGTSWGEDSLGRSKALIAYLEGRTLALTRLDQLLAGQDATDFNRSLDVFGSAGFSEPNLPAGRPARNIDYTERGYEEVINILRRMPRNTDLGRDLARKLEVMPIK